MGMIRPIREADARAFLELSNTLDAESDFRLLEPGERRTTVQEEREIIRRTNADLAADQPRVTLEDLRELIKEVSDVE